MNVSENYDQTNNDNPPSPERGPFLARLLILGGLLALGLSVSADWLGISSETQFSSRQVACLVVGCIAFVVGVLLDVISGRREVVQWCRARWRDRRGLLAFGFIASQLVLLVFVIERYDIESPAFFLKVMRFVLVGFVIHHFLAPPLRLPFFFLISLGSLVSVLGFHDARWLVGTGLILIGICHLPIPFNARILAQIVTVGIFMALRVELIASPFPGAIWPILGSMFMFRLVVYMYDLKHQKAPFSIPLALSYFFMLPNVVFPLFPIVDYSTFCRTRYNEDAFQIYQRGLKWMTWGILHLIIYRFINYYVVIPAVEVTNTATLCRYMVSNYLLIIRLSGQFHLIVGILLLFGFNLPRIMNLYFLASSFTDYWRRVNVYWKDFIQKVFYYPAYFRLRRWGDTSKIVACTLFGSTMTWFFHAFQWYWIRGAFLFSAPDMVFWLSLGLLVLVGALAENRFGRKRTVGRSHMSPSELVSRALRTVGVFITITVLWSIWVSPSLSSWYQLVFLTPFNPLTLFIWLAALTAVIMVSIVVFERPSIEAVAGGRQAKLVFRPAVLTIVPLVALAALTQCPQTLFGEKTANVVRELQTTRLSRQDEALMVQGYYEKLKNVGGFNSELWKIYSQRPRNWNVLGSEGATRKTGDVITLELLPLVQVEFKGATLKTNRWKMRDQDYEKTPRAKTCRIAVVGGSIAFGSGVDNDQTFEAQLERMLNSEESSFAGGEYEVLNFSLGGHTGLQRTLILERQVFEFKPHMVIYTGHPIDWSRDGENVALNFAKGVDLSVCEPLRQLCLKAGVQLGCEKDEAKRRIGPYAEELHGWMYPYIVDLCRKHDCVPVFICLPQRAGRNEADIAQDVIRSATQAGFVVMDLCDVYDGVPGESVVVAPWDWHPNARGHRLIAKRLLHEFNQRRGELPLDRFRGKDSTVMVPAKAKQPKP